MATDAQIRNWTGPSRRRVPRLPLQSPLDVTVVRSAGQETVPGRSLNVCERGISAALAGELAPGEEVEIKLELPQAKGALRARAVVRHQDKLRCGFEFIGLSTEQRAVIRESLKQAKTVSSVDERPKRMTVRKSADGGAGMRKPSMGTFSSSSSPGSSSASSSFSPASSESKPTAAVPSATTSISNPITKLSATPATAAATSGGSSSGGSSSGGSSSGSRRRYAPAKNPRGRSHDLLLGFLILLIIVATAFWWKWNQGWEELESGLHKNEAAAVKPQAQVATEVMEKLLVHRVQPTYPAEARNDNLQGIIALDIVVGRDGSVVGMHALNGPEVLARAAMDALRWWKFEPYRVNGEPAVVETTMAVEFKR